MHISLAPVRGDTPRRLHREGDVLTVDGVAYDFSALPEGATLPRDAVQGDWLASDVERTGGVLRMTVILPHGAAAPEATRFPAPIMAPQDGPIPLPPHDTQPENHDEH